MGPVDEADLATFTPAEMKRLEVMQEFLQVKFGFNLLQSNQPQLAAYALSDSPVGLRSEEHTSELQSLRHLVCRLLLEKKKLLRAFNHHTSKGARDSSNSKPIALTAPRFADAMAVTRASTSFLRNGTSERKWKSKRPVNAVRSRVGRSSCPGGLNKFRAQFSIFNDPATTEIYTLSLHDALPI